MNIKIKKKSPSPVINSDKNNEDSQKNAKAELDKRLEMLFAAVPVSDSLRYTKETDTENEHQEDSYYTDFIADKLSTIPLLSPKQMYDELENLGYRGQNNARRSVCIYAYRHLKRLRRIYLDKEPIEQVGKKNNILLMGPTGSGKTYIIELLFQKILKLPTVIVDVTSLSETGFVGQDPSHVMTYLYHKANYDERLARIGIVCLDEFDKLASSQNNAIFAGAGTTKDITGIGVQKELLKMIESKDVIVPVEMNHSSYVETVTIPTRDVGFIGIGAFSGFSTVLNRFYKSSITGFSNRTDKPLKHWDDNAIAISFTPEDVEKLAHFQTYGFLPELIARFNKIVPFEALDKETLRAILKVQIIRNTVKEFALEGIELEINDDVIDHIIKKALQKEAGARGLNSFIDKYLEKHAFELFGSENDVKLSLFMENDAIKSKLTK